MFDMFVFGMFEFWYVVLRPAVGDPGPVLVLPENLCKRQFFYTPRQINIIPNDFKWSHDMSSAQYSGKTSENTPFSVMSKTF